MPTPAKVLPQMSFDESQEERLMRLEERSAEFGSELSGINVTLQYMGRSIENIGSKIDLIVAPINARLNAFETRVGEHSDVLGGLKRESEARAGRWSSAKKSLLALAIAIAGVAGKELFVFVWHFVSK